jgi:hypothetical protein
MMRLGKSGGGFGDGTEGLDEGLSAIADWAEASAATDKAAMQIKALRMCRCMVMPPSSR